MIIIRECVLWQARIVKDVAAFLLLLQSILLLFVEMVCRKGQNNAMEHLACVPKDQGVIVVLANVFVNLTVK